MSSDDLHHVKAVHLRDDGSVVVHVETTSFAPDEAVEVSGYITQDSSGAYATFHKKDHIPFDFDPATNTPALLEVELQSVEGLTPDNDVTVFTTLAEVWPTFMEVDEAETIKYQNKGLRAVWGVKNSPGKGPWDPASQSPSSGGAPTPA